MSPDPKAAIRCAYLCGRRGVRWPLAWARCRPLWAGPVAWKACAASWNAGRQDGGRYPVAVI